MDESQILYDLEEFARQMIHTDDHSDDDHVFTVYRCHSCNKPEFRITIEHHTGSKDWNFRVIIWCLSTPTETTDEPDSFCTLHILCFPDLREY